MMKLFEKLDWPALRETVHSLEWGIQLPEAVQKEELEQNEELLVNLHKLVIRRQIMEGQMVCPNCERAYEIKNGIANMLLREDEV